MGFRMIVPKRIKKKRTKDGQEVLRRLEEFLKSDTVMKEPVEILCGFWEDQQNAITYQELRKAVKAGGLTQETLKQWQQDYAYLVKTKLTPMWEKAMEVGALKQPLVEAIAGGFVVQTQTPGILSWLRQRGAEFVTSCTTQQKEAIAALVSKKMIEGHTVDELARMIRPCIGLTKEQAKANARYYDHVAATLKEKFPTMRPKTIQKRAQEAAGKYAERQHRARAMTIAQTESAFAYNQGADEGIRQAQVQGLIGKTKKRWNTAGTDSVCKLCAELDGKEFEMDADFPLKGEPLFPGQHKLPPAHPRCGCAIEYIEIEPPVPKDIPEMKVKITGEDSFKEYSTEEIEEMARQTEEIVSKHLSIPSKWSGKMIVTDEGVREESGHVVHYGKLWSCDIVTKHETAPAIIMHEQIHARSISYYGENIYTQFFNIEEATVQFMTEEICRQNGIEIIESDYYAIINSLKQIGRYIGIYKTDYEFVKFVIKMPVAKRLDWISSNLYDTLGRDTNATVEDYQNWSDILNVLYTKR